MSQTSSRASPRAIAADARVHGGERRVVADAFVAHAPFDRRRAGGGKSPIVRSSRVLTTG